MWNKLKESKRVIAYAGTLLGLGSLLCLCWLMGDKVEQGVQTTLAATIKDAVAYGLPALLASIGWTDSIEAKVAAK